MPDATVIGTLTLRSGDCPNLEIRSHAGEKPEGSLAARIESMESLAEDLIVHGQSASGRLFTLYDGFVRNSNLGMGAISTALLDFNRGIEGACIDAPSALSVQRVRMRYPGIDAWFGARPFKVNHDAASKRVMISHTIPERESFQIDNERRLTLAWSRKGPNESAVQTRISLEALPWVEIEYSTAVTQDKAADDASVVGALLSMLLGAPTATREMSMFSPDWTFEHAGKVRQDQLKALGAHIKLPRSFRKWTPHDVLIPLRAVRAQFESLLQRWFKVYHECRNVIGPYLASQLCPASFAQSRFFDLAATAESLHTHFRADKRSYPDAVARAIRRKLLGCVPTQHRTSFRNALQRVNGLTYRQRLERLLQRFPTLAEDTIGDSGERAAFCKLVKDLRNIEAHRLKPTGRTAVGGLKLVRIASKLRVILDAWILAEIGIAESAIEEAMRSNGEYWFYACRRSWPWNIAADA